MDTTKQGVMNHAPTNTTERQRRASALEKQIDEMAYVLYALTPEDIAEVENWYARRYPKLVKAQNNKKV